MLQGAGGLPNQPTDPVRPDMRTILDGLRRSQQSNPSLSPSVYEAKPDLNLPLVAGPGENQAGLDLLHAKLGGNPALDFQRQQVADTEEQQRQAWLGGDASPQEAARHAEEEARYKIDAPVRAQEVSGKYGLQQQEIQSQGQRDVANTQKDAAINTSPYSPNFLDRMAKLPGGMDNIRSLGKSSISFNSPTNLNPLLGQVTNMRYAAEQAIGRKWSWDGPSPEERALRQSIENVFLQDHATPPDVKDTVRQVLSDPQYAGMTNEDIIHSADNDDGSPLTPIQQQKLMEYLSAFR